MKSTVNKSTLNVFQPITLTVTIESEAELRVLTGLWGLSGPVSRAVVESRFVSGFVGEMEVRKILNETFQPVADVAESKGY